MLEIRNVPLSVYNRALELYGEEPCQTVAAAQDALMDAESCIDIKPEWPGISPFIQAVAEHVATNSYKIVPAA